MLIFVEKSLGFMLLSMLQQVFKVVFIKLKKFPGISLLRVSRMNQHRFLEETLSECSHMIM